MNAQSSLFDDVNVIPSALGPSVMTHRERFLAGLLAEWTWPGKAWEKRPLIEREIAGLAARGALFRMGER